MDGNFMVGVASRRLGEAISRLGTWTIVLGLHVGYFEFCHKALLR